MKVYNSICKKYRVYIIIQTDNNNLLIFIYFWYMVIAVYLSWQIWNDWVIFFLLTRPNITLEINVRYIYTTRSLDPSSRSYSYDERIHRNQYIKCGWNLTGICLYCGTHTSILTETLTENRKWFLSSNYYLYYYLSWRVVNILIYGCSVGIHRTP